MPPISVSAPMSQPPSLRARPLSPHLSIYKPIPTMISSIVHRITGGALYFGTLLVAVWLVSAASGAASYETASAFFGSFFGRLILFGYTWALIHHMLGGIRHLVWDTGRGMDKHAATKIAFASVSASIILTFIVWIIAYVVR